MTGSLDRRVDEVFSAVPEEDLVALWNLDRFEAERIAARRRYEDFGDRPLAPGPRGPR
jgi:hypothetical protein